MPNADYLCGPCVEAGAISVEEPMELPVMSKVCPLCGEATLERVWSGARSNPMPVRGARPDPIGARQIEHASAAAYDEARASHDSAVRGRAMLQKTAGWGIQMCGVNELPARLQRMGLAPAALPSGTSRPTPAVSSPLLAGTVAGRKLTPGRGSLVDKEHPALPPMKSA